jgi:hypothetical protein
MTKLKLLMTVFFQQNIGPFEQSSVYQNAAKYHNSVIRDLHIQYPTPQFLVTFSACTDYATIYYSELDFSI